MVLVMFLCVCVFVCLLFPDVAVAWDGPAHHTLWLHGNGEHDGHDTGGAGCRDSCQGEGGRDGEGEMRRDGEGEMRREGGMGREGGRESESESDCFVMQIQLNHGGTFSALKEEPLHDWLKKQNPTYVHVWRCLFFFSTTTFPSGNPDLTLLWRGLCCRVLATVWLLTFW